MRGLLAVVVMAGCVDAGPTEYDIDGDGKADGNGTCEDAKYGDGTCHIDLACGIPDIDCFKPYASDEEATAASSAALESYGMTTLPITDARYATTRARVDKAWDLYKESVPLGKLAEQRLSLVLMNDPSVNAFVMPTETPGVGMFSVHVNAGLIDAPGMTDDQFAGIFFHELTHLAKLHLSDEVSERLRRYYVTPTDTSEPLGSTQIQHEQLRSRMQQWRAMTLVAGWFIDPALGDFPVESAIGDLLAMYLGKVQTSTPACAPQVEAVTKVSGELKLASYNQELVIPAGWSTRLDTALTALKTCTATDLMTFKQFRDSLDAEWQSYLTTELKPEDAYLDETRALDAILALSYDRRLKLRMIENDIASVSGRPFSALRFFSQEEQADDVSARVTKVHGLDEVGSSGFLMAALALGNENAQCEGLLEAGGNLPYGRILDDDHHADCWRIAHMRRVADNTERAIEIKDRAPAPWTPTRVRKGPLY